MQLRERQDQTGVRCAYCHGQREGPMQTCPACRSVQHAGCHRALGACSTLGCVGARPAGTAEAASPPLLAVGLAVLLGAGVASLQEALLASPTLTRSDVVALALTAVLLSAWLGSGWIVDRGGASGVVRAIPVLAYLGVGLTISSSALHDGIWFGAAGLVFAQQAIQAAWPRA